MKRTFQVKGEKDLGPVAIYLIDLLKSIPLLLLEGDMGVGKTALTKRILLEKGCKEVSSPTFSLVNRYDTDEGPWYHFDLYRVEVSDELYDIGFEEYLESGDPCIIEWPEIAMELITTEGIRAQISMDGDKRVIKISH